LPNLEADQNCAGAGDANVLRRAEPPNPLAMAGFDVMPPRQRFWRREVDKNDTAGCSRGAPKPKGT